MTACNYASITSDLNLQWQVNHICENFKTQECHNNNNKDSTQIKL